ncbi:MAG: hypothetical protein PHH21_03355 [Candidatus Pacebacteria bacterium]|nr:hypothetical protein [Candidatus Paceibacterota bacterium]
MDEEKYNWMLDDCPYKSHTFRFVWAVFKIVSWPYYFIFVKIKLRKISGFHEEMAKSKRVDFFPEYGQGRGFIIVLDQKTALFFNQEGDHFVYDGCEMGEYGKGNVAIFDRLNDNN